MAVGQSGQVVTESVLMLVVMLAAMTLLISGLKNANYIESMTVNPWARVQGMIECGAWQPCGINTKSAPLHPSNWVVSFRPDGQETN